MNKTRTKFSKKDNKSKKNYKKDIKAKTKRSFRKYNNKTLKKFKVYYLKEIDGGLGGLPMYSLIGCAHGDKNCRNVSSIPNDVGKGLYNVGEGFVTGVSSGVNSIGSLFQKKDAPLTQQNLDNLNGYSNPRTPSVSSYNSTYSSSSGDIGKAARRMTDEQIFGKISKQTYNPYAAEISLNQRNINKRRAGPNISRSF